jgi:hypothetical protein
MSSEKSSARRSFSYELNRAPQPFAITCSHCGKGRAIWTRLAKGQIATQHDETSFRECVAERNQQPSLAVASSAMSENQSTAVRLRWQMNKASDTGLSRAVRDRLYEDVGLCFGDRQSEKE